VFHFALNERTLKYYSPQKPALSILLRRQNLLRAKTKVSKHRTEQYQSENNVLRISGNFIF
jgi:hypothetical protein